MILKKKIKLSKKDQKKLEKISNLWSQIYKMEDIFFNSKK